MPNFAVINNNEVINTILGESKQIVEDALKLTCVEFGDETVEIGSKYFNEVFYNKPKDGNTYIWDNETLTWVISE